MTLLEMTIATVAFMVVIGAVYSVLASGSQTVHATTVSGQLERKVERIARRIGRTAMLAGASTLLPSPQAPLGSSQVSFQCSQGWANDAMVWGPVISVGLEDDIDDPADGMDNDGDGCIDEATVVWRRDVGGPNEVSEIWVDNVRRFMDGEIQNNQDDNGDGLVDEAGLSFVLQGSTLVIRLCLERRGVDGRVVTRVARHAVRLRN
jgi:hypothetical protein